MKRKKTFSQEELRYLKLLAQQYPTVQAASSEIINLQAIMNLPKGTEHFISDLHGEYEAFLHILNSCSGVIKEKVDDLFASTISKADREELCTLIYYPEDKLEQLHAKYQDMDEWYRITLHRLLEICRWVSSKYTRSKVRKALPKDYAYIIDELLHTHYDEADKRDYYENIISTIIDLGQADRFIEAVSAVIKRMAVDHMHIVGDIFDRGPRADIIMDSLLDYHSVDIQWGNHDILWMGAASGSRTLVATVLANSIHYNNLEVIETGYGISLRPLSVFANEVYRDCETSTASPSSSPAPTRTSTARKINSSPPGCTRPSPSSSSSWRARSCCATRSTAWRTGCCWTRSTMRASASPSAASPTPWRMWTSPPWTPRTPTPSPRRRTASSTSSPPPSSAARSCKSTCASCTPRGACIKFSTETSSSTAASP